MPCRTVKKVCRAFHRAPTAIFSDSTGNVSQESGNGGGCLHKRHSTRDCIAKARALDCNGYELDKIRRSGFFFRPTDTLENPGIIVSPPPEDDEELVDCTSRVNADIIDFAERRPDELWAPSGLQQPHQMIVEDEEKIDYCVDTTPMSAMTPSPPLKFNGNGPRQSSLECVNTISAEARCEDQLCASAKDREASKGCDSSSAEETCEETGMGPTCEYMLNLTPTGEGMQTSNALHSHPIAPSYLLLESRMMDRMPAELTCIEGNLSLNSPRSTSKSLECTENNDGAMSIATRRHYASRSQRVAARRSQHFYMVLEEESNTAEGGEGEIVVIGEAVVVKGTPGLLGGERFATLVLV